VGILAAGLFFFFIFVEVAPLGFERGLELLPVAVSFCADLGSDPFLATNFLPLLVEMLLLMPAPPLFP
jgi:hypothetical protein